MASYEQIVVQNRFRSRKKKLLLVIKLIDSYALQVQVFKLQYIEQHHDLFQKKFIVWVLFYTNITDKAM